MGSRDRWAQKNRNKDFGRPRTKIGLQRDKPFDSGTFEVESQKKSKTALIKVPSCHRYHFFLLPWPGEAEGLTVYIVFSSNTSTWLITSVCSLIESCSKFGKGGRIGVKVNTNKIKVLIMTGGFTFPICIKE